MLIVLNMIIAILTDTYATMMEQRDGLQNAKIIEAMSTMKHDKEYGGLIMASPPLTVFTVPLLPIYLCVRNKKVLQNTTWFYSKIVYTPFALFFLALQIALNCIMMPFAYLKTLLHKIILPPRR